MNSKTATTYAALALSGVVALSVGQRLLLWQQGTDQYASAGAAPWVYPAITILQGCACVALLFKRTRAIAAAGVFLIPTTLVLRRVLMNQVSSFDAVVLAVAALGLVVVVGTLLSANKH